MSGWKQWGIGEVVEAGDFQSYVQDQTVQVFATEAARTTALGTAVSEGMVSYLSDSNSVQVYTGSEWQGIAPQSPNYIINGAFDIWQRGTAPVTTNGYTADRWGIGFSSGGAGSVTQQEFTEADLPVASYGEGAFYLQADITTGGAFTAIYQRIESARTLAGQTVTVSFWAKGTSPTAGLHLGIIQNFGTGGSSQVSNSAEINFGSITSTWTRYTGTFTVPSISGKTIGTANDYFQISLGQRGGDTSTAAWNLDIWGVQLEAGSVATPFRRHAPSLQGELAACQRYYRRWNYTNANPISTGIAFNTTVLMGELQRTPMRAVPTFVTSGNFAAYPGLIAVTLGNFSSGPDSTRFDATGSGFTAKEGYSIRSNGNSYIETNGAEL